MDIWEQDALFAEMKKIFLAGELSEYDPKHSRIVAGWQESQKAGANPHCTMLTDEQRDLHVFDRIDNLSKCHLAYFKDYYDSRSSALEKLGCAIFYLDTDLTVFHKGGNPDFLEELKYKGLRTGTVFSVKNVGAFAGNTALGKPFINCFSAGQGHYTDLLSSYACLARYGESSVNQSFHVVTVIFFPLGKCTKSAINSATFMLEAGDFTYKNRFLYPHVERRFHLLEQSTQYSPDLLMLVDESGDIAFINSRLENEFGLSLTHAIDQPLREQLPALSFVLESLHTGQELSERNIMLTDKNGVDRFYYVECLPIRENGALIGLMVTLKTPDQIRKYIYSSNPGGAVFNFSDITGESPVMKELRKKALAAASSPANILITGESGTGKELFAQSIHNASHRADAPFVPINCGAMPRELFGAELFGYETGAYAGDGRKGRTGKFEQADGGTLFLDEISEMAPDMQAFLLRFLEDGVVTRVDGRCNIHLDVRIIAATNRDLLKCVNDGAFRLDLYYRLNVMRLDLPPLRERREDIGLLTNHFVSTLSAKYGKNIFTAAPETVRLLESYYWPGNLRELRNLIERFIVSAPPGEPLVISSLPPDMVPVSARGLSEPASSGLSLFGQPFSDYELVRIKNYMTQYNGNKSRVAKALGMSRGTLYKRLKVLGFE